MQDIVVPPLVPPTTEGNLSDIPARWAETEPGRITHAINDGSGTWADVTAAEFNRQVRDLAKGFMAAGLQTGDRVAIMSKTRYEWTLCDFALWTAGLVVVPIYETSSSDQVEWIMSDSGAAAIIAETTEHMAIVSELRERLTALKDVWHIEGSGLDEIVAAGAEVSEEDLDARRGEIDRTALATIIYTSGTTGRPKGCELTHDNFYALCENATERLAVVLQPGARLLLFLPLAHVFARFIEVLVVYAGVTLGHTPDPKMLLDDVKSFKPTLLLSVPRVFEKIYNASEQKAEGEGKGKIFRRAAKVAHEWSAAQDTGGPGLLLRIQHALFDKLVYAKLREALGGNVTYAVSGGAALGGRLGHFYRGIGLIVLEGYGLTETTAPATVNTPDLIKIGSVGPPLPGVAVRIAEDGEILVKGNNVLRGYYNNPEATAEAIKDGWFHTGDLGELDADGFLRITGRKKEILVTQAGKNVSPAVLEDRLRGALLVSQCMVVGDGKPFIGALITLDEEMLPTWAKNHDLEGLTVEEARTHPKVLAEVQEAVDYANKAVSRAESIRKFHILDRDFTEANGFLTPSMKLKLSLIHI